VDTKEWYSFDRVISWKQWGSNFFVAGTCHCSFALYRVSGNQNSYRKRTLTSNVAFIFREFDLFDCIAKSYINCTLQHTVKAWPFSLPFCRDVKWSLSWMIHFSSQRVPATFGARDGIA
jgi:hypothetical protein